MYVHVIVKAPVCLCALHVCSCVFTYGRVNTYLRVASSVLAFVCAHLYIFCPTLCFLGGISSHIVRMHALAELYLHVFAQKLRKAARRLTRQLSIPNTFPFECFSNAVVYNFNQSVNSLAGFSRCLSLSGRV